MAADSAPWGQEVQPCCSIDARVEFIQGLKALSEKDLKTRWTQLELKKELPEPAGCHHLSS